MDTEFLDLQTKAKELNITDSLLRAKILSHDGLHCFAFVSNLLAFGEQERCLPPWSAEQFPFVRWEDLGSPWERKDFLNPKSPPKKPRYVIHGWVIVEDEKVDEILTRGRAGLNKLWVWVVTADLDRGFPVQLCVDPDEEWVEADDYEAGGYYRQIERTLSRDDLYLMSSRKDEGERPLAPRKERSYLGIIAAMRALLMDKDGGGFPSQAKVIELLEERYSYDGVSKRNLEAVFADAARMLNGDAKAKR